MKFKKILPSIIGFALLAIEMTTHCFIENSTVCLVINGLLIVLALIMFNLQRLITWIKGEKQETDTPKSVPSKPARILLIASIIGGMVIACVLLIVFYCH